MVSAYGLIWIRLSVDRLSLPTPDNNPLLTLTAITVTKIEWTHILSLVFRACNICGSGVISTANSPAKIFDQNSSSPLPAAADDAHDVSEDVECCGHGYF